MRKLLLGLSLVLAAACTPEPTPMPEQQFDARVAGGFLTQQDAAYRKSAIANPAYSLALELDRDENTYGGRVEISFDYIGDGAPLTLDFNGGQVQGVNINGEAVAFEYNGYFITLPAGAVSAGATRLRIDYSQNYSQDGAGLYRYVDPVDSSVYLYSDFEPYDANRMFPHFDQPDLKARYTLQVSAPSDWQVVSSNRETQVSSEEERSLWRFPPTELMSSYVFSLHAGEYVVFEDKDFRYPLRLFARKSMAQYVEADEWFEMTRVGFDYFDEYFQLPYPFVKYDQLLVPDYNSGAMENVAAVTFSETFLQRGESTRRQRLDLASTIFHEMAHMWFGDITTMAWWNGLWLNESFATYMANLALANATDYDETWQEFFMGAKNWAYTEDQLVTTHPIELPVANTADAFTNFDGITYGKGASTLKQLAALLGEDVFRQGVRDYLAANAWKNTELEDFMGAMSKAANQDLGDWTQRWLYQAGLNSIETGFSCENGKISQMVLLQSAPAEYPTLREQRTQIGLFSRQADSLVVTDTVALIFDGARTEVTDAVGLPCPDFVYPNYQDWAYIKVRLDDRSIAAARADMNALKDPMQRTMTWYDLFAMALDAELPLTDYLDILAENLPSEKNLSTASDLLGNLRTGMSYLNQVPQSAQLLPLYADTFEPLLWQLVQNSTGDARRTWLGGYIDVANNDRAFTRLDSLLRDKTEVELDQDQRWRAIHKLNEFARPHSAELARAEAQHDNSSIGQENAVRAIVLAARGEEKWAWMQRAVARDDQYTLQRSRTIQRGLFPYSSQRQLAAPFSDRMIAQLPEVSERHEDVFHKNVTRGLFPRLCSAENVARLRQASAQLTDLNPFIVRALKIAAQFDQRCVDIGALLAR